MRRAVLAFNGVTITIDWEIMHKRQKSVLSEAAEHHKPSTCDAPNANKRNGSPSVNESPKARTFVSFESDDIFKVLKFL